MYLVLVHIIGTGRPSMRRLRVKARYLPVVSVLSEFVMQDAGLLHADQLLVLAEVQG